MSEEYPDDWKPLADRRNRGREHIIGKAAFDRSEYVAWARKRKRRQRIKDVLFALFLISIGTGALYWIYF